MKPGGYFEPAPAQPRNRKERRVRTANQDRPVRVAIKKAAEQYRQKRASVLVEVKTKK